MISFPSAASIILQLKYLNDNINNIIFDNKSIYKMIIQIKNDNEEINCISPEKRNINYLNEKRKFINENNYDELLFFKKEDKKYKLDNKSIKI